jgi:hypothetical protein
LKIFKEFIPFLYQKARLYSVPTNKLKLQNRKKEIPVVVSLTTIPSRINLVHLTIRSILAQNAKPKRIVLWINEDLKNLVTSDLQKLEGEVFEICYSKIDCPHLKLLEELKNNTKLPIITIDDDQIYSKNLLSELYKSHLNKPNSIISTISRLIKFDENENPLPYQQWPYVEKLNFEDRFLLPLGVYGVLYPPNCFNAAVTNIDLIERLSPKADDLWFKALSIIEGTQVKIIGEKINKPTMVLGTQKITLKKHNVSQDNNRIQWKKLMDHFKIEVAPQNFQKNP